KRLTSEIGEPHHLASLRINFRMRGPLPARVHETTALEPNRIELKWFTMLMQSHQLAGMMDDVNIRRPRIDAGHRRIARRPHGAEQRTPSLVHGQPSRRANPAVSISGAPAIRPAAIFVRLKKEPVDHAIAMENKMRS